MGGPFSMLQSHLLFGPVTSSTLSSQRVEISSVPNNWQCQGPRGLWFCPSPSNKVAASEGSARHLAKVPGGIAQCEL